MIRSISFWDVGGFYFPPFFLSFGWSFVCVCFFLRAIGSKIPFQKEHILLQLNEPTIFFLPAVNNYAQSFRNAIQNKTKIAPFSSKHPIVTGIIQTYKMRSNRPHPTLVSIRAAVRFLKCYNIIINFLIANIYLEQ